MLEEILKHKKALCALLIVITSIIIIIVLLNNNSENKILSCSKNEEESEVSFELYQDDNGYVFKQILSMDTNLKDAEKYMKVYEEQLDKKVSQYIKNTEYYKIDSSVTSKKIKFEISYYINEDNYLEMLSYFEVDFYNSSTKQLVEYFEGGGYKCTEY